MQQQQSQLFGFHDFLQEPTHSLCLVSDMDNWLFNLRTCSDSLIQLY